MIWPAEAIMGGFESSMRSSKRKDSEVAEHSFPQICVGVLVMFLAFGLGLTARADRTQIKPGFNLFSPQQDIDLGQKYSHEVERQLSMCNDPRVDTYLNALGKRLVAHAPSAPYLYQYKCVNDMAINAFALPGGFIYINRGVIELADDEAQLAGVMAHETSHVALRHSTNHLTKQYAAEIPLALLGGLMGNSSIASVLAQLGVQNGMQLMLLKFSRTDESQADVLGTQILYDSEYDPRAMGQFFEKIEAESKNRPIEFLSDHPSPENRVQGVQEEVQRLGGPPPNYKTDSPEFQEIKRIVHALPLPPKKPTPATN
jgi:predicted Zn-dependent protease